MSMQAVIRPRRLTMGLTCAAALAVALASSGSSPAAGGERTGTTSTVATQHARHARGGVATAVDNWTTYHHGQVRHGYDGQAAQASGHLAIAWKAQLDGAVYGEPLVVNGTIVAATENDSIYGLSQSGKVLWRRHVGSPVPLSTLPCGNIDPVGITGTPMYAASSGDVYFSGELNNPIRHILYAVDVSDGHLDWSRNLDVSGMHPIVEQQRGAMAIAQGRVWVSFGALAGDCGDYHGYEIGVRLDGIGIPSVYRTPSKRGAGIWAPTGPSVGPKGNLFVAPANGAAFHPPYDDSDSVIKLDGNQMISLWAPRNWAEENASDMGQGPAAPLLFSAFHQPWGFSLNKAGHVFLLHANNLGGIGGQAAEAQDCPAFGGMAFLRGVIYVPCREGVTAYTIKPGPKIVRLWRNPDTGYGSAPVIGGGAVWAIAGGTLYQIAPGTGRTVTSIAIGTNPHFATPTLHGDLVLAGTMTGVTAVQTDVPPSATRR
jgi:outer membrane protein assembly factor BamB